MIRKYLAFIFFLFWAIWLSLEFLLGPYSHVRIHDAGDGFLPQAIAAKIQFDKYGLFYFADYMASGVDASAQILVPLSNFNSLLFTVLPGYFAMGILMFLQRFIASYFTYKLLRQILKIDLFPSIIAALMFSLFNFSMFSFTFYHQLGLPALPLVLYALEKIINNSNLKIFALILAGLLFGYVSYFVYSSIYLLPFIFLWFLLIRKQFGLKVIFSLILFSALTLLVQLPSIYALINNSGFSHRLIWDPIIFLRESSPVKSIFFDLKSKIWASIIPLFVILLSLKLIKKASYLSKILLVLSIAILIVPIIVKFVQIYLPPNFVIARTLSFERFDLLIPFILSITCGVFLNLTSGKIKPVVKVYVFAFLITILILNSLRIKIETIKNYAPYKNLYMHPQLVELSNKMDNTRYRVVTITGGGIRSSYALAYGLYTVDSYVTLYPKSYHDFWAEVITKRIQNDQLRYDDFVKWGNRIYLYGPEDFYSLRSIEFQKYYDLDLLSLTGVKYIISQKPVSDSDITLLPSDYRDEFKDWDKFSKIQKLTKFIRGQYYGPPLYIYENKKALSRFFVLENDQISDQKVTINFYSPDKITVTINIAKPASLIATINYYPWWKATINGKEAIISKYQDTFMSLEIPEGDNIITFEYDPPYKII